MKILKLLNKIQITLYVFLFLIVNFKVFSNEPVDIWSLNQSEQKKKRTKN